MSTEGSGWDGLKLAGGRYRIAHKLGEGGMGVVYRAHDRHLNTDVVIKVPHRMILNDAASVERFAREVRSLVELSHPNVVRILDVGQCDGLPFAVMQYLAGGSLRDRQRVGPDGRAAPIEPEQLSGWLVRVAEALDFIHSRGYVHRDVKPPNILFDENGNVYLSDFGVAKAVCTAEQSPHAKSLTGTGMVFGTADYMAPEVIEGKPYDGHADQYSLAVTVYELLAGRNLYHGLAPAAVLVEKATKPAPSLAAAAPSVSKTTVDAVDQGLSKAPTQRFATCTQFAAAVVSSVTASVETAVPAAEADADRRSGPAAHGVPPLPFGEIVGRAGESLPAADTDAVAAAELSTSEQSSGGAAVVPTHRSGWRGAIEKPMFWLATAVGLILVAGTIFWISVLHNEFPPAASKVVSPASSTNDPVVAQDEPAVDDTSLTDPVVAQDEPAVDDTSLTAKPPVAEKQEIPKPAQRVAPDLAIAPLDATQAKMCQVDWARYLGLPVQTTNSIGMHLVLIPPGEFLMGCPYGPDELVSLFPRLRREAVLDEQPQHTVRITRPLLMAAHEVTLGQFRYFVNDTDYKTEAEENRDGKGGCGYNSATGENEDHKPYYNWLNAGFEQSEDHPVLNVTWNDAAAFCSWLSQKEGRNYRLPTEAEWEYACRAGTTTEWYHGDDIKKNVEFGNTRDASAKKKFPKGIAIEGEDGHVFTSRVGSFRANAFGLYDMCGNLFELCADTYDKDYYRHSPVEDPPGPITPGGTRVMRGGSWRIWAPASRSAYREDVNTSSRGKQYGFRPVGDL